MSKGYTDVDAVALHIGRTFSGEQSVVCERVIGAVEKWIEAHVGKTWEGLLATATDEQHSPTGRFLYVRNVPVVAITVIKVQSDALLTSTTLTAASYALQDVALGKIYLPGYAGYLVKVTYTYDPDPVPADVKLAAEITTAEWMRPVLEGVGENVAAYNVGGEISVTYRKLEEIGVVPTLALALLSNHRMPAAQQLFY